jgi:hypothetical protein
MEPVRDVHGIELARCRMLAAPSAAGARTHHVRGLGALIPAHKGQPGLINEATPSALAPSGQSFNDYAYAQSCAVP